MRSCVLAFFCLLYTLVSHAFNLMGFYLAIGLCFAMIINAIHYAWILEADLAEDQKEQIQE